MTDKNWGARLPLAIGFAAVAVLVLGTFFWSIRTEIAGAIVARGTVEVENQRQVIQHPDGGVVGEILVRNGDSVSAGDVLIRLDGTFLRSELIIVERQLAELYARRARLIAERDGAAVPDFDMLLEFQLVGQDTVRDQIEGQRNLFTARQNSLAQAQDQLHEQQVQVERQIEGAEAQLRSQNRQLSLTESELNDAQSLFDQGLLQRNRLLELQRGQARLEGEIGRLMSGIAEARARISALRIETLKLVDGRREEAITRLRDLQFSEIELEERRLSLTERLARLDVRAPVNGIVFGSRVVSVQSVVSPAEPIMFLVPGDQPLQVSARIDPVDIDQVYPGQDVMLMFTTFNRRTTPEVPGVVNRVSADAQRDETSGITYYEATLEPDGAALSSLENVTLLPGMPVEVFLRTENRTPLSFLVQPVMIYFNRAFRGE